MTANEHRVRMREERSQHRIKWRLQHARRSSSDEFEETQLKLYRQALAERAATKEELQ
jgi:hypothetical protein